MALCTAWQVALARKPNARSAQRSKELYYRFLSWRPHIMFVGGNNSRYWLSLRGLSSWPLRKLGDTIQASFRVLHWLPFHGENLACTPRPRKLDLASGQ